MNVHDLTRAFNRKYRQARTEESMHSALHNHGIRCGRKQGDMLYGSRLRIFTEKQIQFIRDNYAGRSGKEMTAIFNNRFGAGMTVQQIKTAVHNRGITSGRSGCFPKGHRPWNYGSKGQGLTGRSKTSFKPGNIPPNRKPLWSERVDSKDGFILIKVPQKDPYRGFPTRYKHKHVYCWEQANGPVPEGMVVSFVDGNNKHWQIKNLMLITRAELLQMNKIGYKNAPDEIKPSILALAKLKTKMGAIRREISKQ